MISCTHCGASVEPLVADCPTCGNRVELGRLADVLGRVCRACDAFQLPGTVTCSACGAPLDGEGRPAATPPRPAAALPFESPEVEPLPTPLPLAPSIPLPTPLPLAPTPPIRTAAAGLVIDRGVDLEGVRFPLDVEEIGVGRSRGLLRFPGDECLDDLHATVLYRGPSLCVRDEGSTGGTYFRLRDLTAPLRPGDLFAVGDQLLRFRGLLPATPPPAADGTRRAGSPRPTGVTVVLEEVLTGGVPGRVWLRPGPSVTVGRAACAVTLGDDPYLSQSHAEVVVEADGSARLRDLGSSNGTFVRLPPHAEQELRDGDVLRMGREVLRIVVEPSS